MPQAIYFLLFAVGLVLIIKGSDWFIDSAVFAAEAFHIPHIIIGATIISICTTLPETFVSAAAALSHETELAFGNSIGSISANTGFILAVLILFAKPLIENKAEFIQNNLFLLAVMLLTWLAGFLYGSLGIFSGIFLLLAMTVYLVKNAASMRSNTSATSPEDAVSDVLHAADEPPSKVLSGDMLNVDPAADGQQLSGSIIARHVIFFAIGITMVILGANLLVENGLYIAELLHIPPIVVAVTFTSIGTSLPELVTVISSIRKGAVNLGVGNIIGANILNLTQVIGISSLITPISLVHDSSILSFQLPFVFLLSFLALVFGVQKAGSFKRWQGVVLMLFYFIFLCTNILRDQMPILGPIFFG